MHGYIFRSHLLGEDNFFYRDFYTQVATPTMMPSEASRISSKLLRPSWFRFWRLCGCFRRRALSGAHGFDNVRTLTNKGSSNKVYALSQPKIRSCLSFSASAGRAMERQAGSHLCFRPGRRCSALYSNFVTFNGGNFHTDQTVVNQSVLPTDRSVVKPSYVTATISCCR